MRTRAAVAIAGGLVAATVAFTATEAATRPTVDHGDVAALERVAARPQDSPPPDAPRYSRELFDAQRWHDGDGNGCTEDVDVQVRDSDDESRAGYGRCPRIASGTVADPYTGRRVPLNGPRGAQVDHVAPLGYVYAHGAWRWSPEQRRAFALDQRNLLTVDGHENMSKGDRPPRSGRGGYIPPRALSDDGEACDYASRWVGTLDRTGLSVDAETATWLRGALARCRA